MPGALPNIAVVFGKDPQEILALDLADKIIGKFWEPPVDVDERTACELSRQPGRECLGKIFAANAHLRRRRLPI